MRNLADFLAELKRRRVFRVAAVYAGMAFIIFQVVDATFEVMGIPDWLGRFLIVALLLGFPVAVGLAWAFDITDKGVVRTKGEAPAKVQLKEQRTFLRHLVRPQVALPGALVIALITYAVVWLVHRSDEVRWARH